MTDKDIEQEILAKGKIAARITPADVQANIVGEYYFTASEGVQATLHKQDELTRLTGAHGELALLTFCVLVLKNGFTVTGESACASPENFDEGIGRKIARQNAEQKIWPLMGYELKQRLRDAN
ncbi:Gp49 family protein [Pseudomonas auratipiscis]|uniref:Gp49 family protein n=1 Tax=Pseudomonas auratipiscis TaxID=3115853 RepID=A0AB35WYR6_9PSED|nr:MULTISPECIES: Gp49 family protein [unclassified Pseudomonas]MEE1869073.1 Gp49 family protein [Pseudomonas sp. 120P]MEE1959720.1 Gp49 family protein [Pseudomonas sp. 119P]